MDEKQEFLQLLREMWERGDTSLHRIYPSWEDLENNLELKFEAHHSKSCLSDKQCPYCGVLLKVKKPLDELFPYDECKSCKHPFHISSNLAVRKLTYEEEENLPAEWIRVLHTLDKKKIAIIFKLE